MRRPRCPKARERCAPIKSLSELRKRIRAADTRSPRARPSIYILCRERLAERFGTEPERVVLTMNATHAINLAVKGLIREGDVLISDLEHNAVYRPLYALEKQGRIRIRVFHADLDDDEATVRRFRARAGRKQCAPAW